MQTFLPYRDFEKSAKCLDYRRLGKQRVEAKQILNVLLGRTNKKGWRNHPCVTMWRDYELALQEYYNMILKEWIRRGYKNNMEFEYTSYYKHGILRVYQEPYTNPYYCKPEWLNKTFCASHRSNLLRKDPEWYGRFEWEEPNNLPYIWPIQSA